MATSHANRQFSNVNNVVGGVGVGGVTLVLEMQCRHLVCSLFCPPSNSYFTSDQVVDGWPFFSADDLAVSASETKVNLF